MKNVYLLKNGFGVGKRLKTLKINLSPVIIRIKNGYLILRLWIQINTFLR